MMVQIQKEAWRLCRNRIQATDGDRIYTANGGRKKPEVESWTDEEGNEYTGIRQNGTIQGEGFANIKTGVPMKVNSLMGFHTEREYIREVMERK